MMWYDVILVRGGAPRTDPRRGGEAQQPEPRHHLHQGGGRPGHRHEPGWRHVYLIRGSEPPVPSVDEHQCVFMR